MKRYIEKLIAGEQLTTAEATGAMELILSGAATPTQISAFLIALRMKGETIDEITGCALKMKEKASHIRPNVPGYIDCVGTGGDSTYTFNISTTAAFVIAGAGVPIAKHGNRAVSSKSGSADVLERLGVAIDLPPERVQQCVEEIGIGFMFARTFIQAMKYVSPVRAELGVRTVFNILGPLSNPSDANYQAIGVYDKKLTHPLAEVMKNMGVERGLVFSAVADGMDEISNLGETALSEIRDGQVTDRVITPEEFGICRAQPEDIAGGTAEENAQTALAILQGAPGAKRDIVVLNAGAAIYCAGRAEDITAGVKAAQESIDSGKALEKLNQLVALSARLKG